MDTLEIESLLCRDPLVHPLFGGVFPSDRLPYHISYGKRLYVANTDPAEREGQHWIAFFFQSNGECIYFDSYGLPPQIPSFAKFMDRNAIRWKFNEHRLQDVKSIVCGHYCIFFAYHMARGMSLTQLTGQFTQRLSYNDRLVKAFVLRVYGKSPKRGRGQCCRSDACI